MMYSFSGPPQVRRKSIPASRVTSAKDMLATAGFPRRDDAAAWPGLGDDEVPCGSHSPERQTPLAAATAKTSTHLRPRTVPIIGRDQPPSHPSQAGPGLEQ